MLSPLAKVIRHASICATLASVIMLLHGCGNEAVADPVEGLAGHLCMPSIMKTLFQDSTRFAKSLKFIMDTCPEKMEGAIQHCEEFYTVSLHNVKKNITNTYMTACVTEVKNKMKGNEASLVKVQKAVDDFQDSIMVQVADEVKQQFQDVLNSSVGTINLDTQIVDAFCADMTQKSVEALSGFAFAHTQEVQDGCNKSFTCEAAAVKGIYEATLNMTETYVKDCKEASEKGKKEEGKKYVMIKHVVKWVDQPKDKYKDAMLNEFHHAIHRAMMKVGLRPHEILEEFSLRRSFVVEASGKTAMLLGSALVAAVGFSAVGGRFLNMLQYRLRRVNSVTEESELEQCSSDSD